MKEKDFLSRERQDKLSTSNRNQLSTSVELLFAGAIAKVKAEAEEKVIAYTDTISRIKAEATEAIAKVKAEAEEKAKIYEDTIARIKAEAKGKARAYTNTLGKDKPSTTIKALLSEAVAKQVAKQQAKSKAEAAEAIASVKAEAEEKAKAYTDTIARVKAEAEEAIAEQKAKSEAEAAETIAQVKAEAEEKTKTYFDTLARIKAEAEGRARAYTNKLGKDKPSTTIEALFSEAIGKQKAKLVAEVEEKSRAYDDTTAGVKAEAKEAIAKVMAEAKEKAKAYADTTAEVKAEAEEAIAKVMAEAKEKVKAYADTTAGVKAEAEEAIAEQKAISIAEVEEAIAKQKTKSIAEATEAIAKVKAEAEQKAKPEAEVEEKARVYTDTTAGVKADAEEAIAKQKARSIAEVEEAIAEQKAKLIAEFEEAIAEQKAKPEAEVEEKARAYTDTDTTAGVKADAEEAIAKVMAEAKEAIAKVKSQLGAIARVKAEAKEVIAKVKAEVEEKARVYTDTIAEIEAEEKAAMMDESKGQPIFETIQRMAQSPAVLPGEHTSTTSELCVTTIMQKELVWVDPDDSVEQTFAKMQQNTANYVMVGQNGVLEGIVSRSDLAGTISPYLRPEFSKWRRPLDDATLQIRIKWIMSKPVHLISPQKSLEAIMRDMCRFRVRALPVADQQGKVLGLVTEAIIFKAILQSKGTLNIPISDEEHQQSTSPQAPKFKRTNPTKTKQSSLVTA